MKLSVIAGVLIISAVTVTQVGCAKSSDEIQRFEQAEKRCIQAGGQYIHSKPNWSAGSYVCVEQLLPVVRVIHER